MRLPNRSSLPWLTVGRFGASVGILICLRGTASAQRPLGAANSRCLATAVLSLLTARGSLLHSISSSARPRTDCGIVSPSALAVLRLMTNSNRVGR